MKCPYCKQDNNTVTNVYPLIKQDNSLRRMRLCLSCGRSFKTTEEVVEVHRGRKKVYE